MLQVLNYLLKIFLANLSAIRDTPDVEVKTISWAAHIKFSLHSIGLHFFTLSKEYQAIHRLKFKGNFIGSEASTVIGIIYTLQLQEINAYSYLESSLFSLLFDRQLERVNIRLIHPIKRKIYDTHTVTILAVGLNLHFS